jgi:branched-chain amino acid transport system substrate-binding protein
VTYLTSPALPPRLYPESGQRFFTRYRERFRADPDPYAIYGYEAISIALQAIRDAGSEGGNREAVISAFYKIRNRPSVLGTYSIDRNGDTTLADYGAYTIFDGELVFDKALEPKPPT